MKLIEAERKLRAFSEQKRVFRSRELGRVLGESGNTLRSSIKRLLDSGIITRLARDVYWFGDFKGRDVPAIEEVAVALRSGEFNYIGMESAASLWSVISQIPVGRLTVVTTGREGEFNTPFGTIEFIHPAADANEIISNTVDYPGHALRLATKRYAVQGLMRARRSTYLIDWEEVEDGD